jgi:hypothetical protein
MGSYIYGYSKKEKNLPIKATDFENSSIKIGLVKYIGKPSWSYPMPHLDRLVARYENQNLGRTLPNYVCIDDIKKGAEVFDMSKRDVGMPSSTFHDEPYGFGPKIGEIHKEGRNLVFKPLIK